MLVFLLLSTGMFAGFYSGYKYFTQRKTENGNNAHITFNANCLEIHSYSLLDDKKISIPCLKISAYDYKNIKITNTLNDENSVVKIKGDGSYYLIPPNLTGQGEKGQFNIRVKDEDREMVENRFCEFDDTEFIKKWSRFSVNDLILKTVNEYFDD